MSDLGHRLRTTLASFRDALRNRNIALLVIAFAGTCLGGWAGAVAVSVYAFHHGGTTALGIFMAVRLFPNALVSPFAGTLADRYPHTRLMVAADVASAVTVVATAALIMLDAPVAAVFATAIARGVVGAPFAPARGALTPTLARTPEELTATNVVSGSVEALAVFLGPALAGLLLAATSFQVVFFVVAATFVWSALLVSRIRVPAAEEAEAEPGAEPEAERAAPSFLTETMDGIRAVAGDPVLRVVVGLFVLQFLVNGLLNVLTVAIALDMLDLGDGGVGTLSGAVGVGGLVGLALTLPLVGARRLAPTFATGLVLWGLPLALIPLLPTAAFALVMLGVIGIGSELADVAGITLLQRSASSEILGRVFGILESGILLMLGLGGVLAPVLIGVFGLETALVLSGVWLPLLVAVLYRALGRVDAATATSVNEADVALLLGVPMFAALPAYTVEQLAADLEVRTAAAGETIVRQGEHADRFYVIAAGRTEVVVDDEPVRTLAAGDWFGEIALLGESARTATVRALTDVELRVLDGDRFVAAVTGHAASRRAADSVVAARLAAARPAHLGSVA
jgi:MFS family permease